MIGVNVTWEYSAMPLWDLVSDDKHFEDQTLKLPSAFLEDLKVCAKIHPF